MVTRRLTTTNYILRRRYKLAKLLTHRIKDLTKSGDKSIPLCGEIGLETSYRTCSDNEEVTCPNCLKVVDDLKG